MKNRIKNIIGSLMTLVLIIMSTPQAYAIFSPPLAQEVNAIKQNIRNVQQQVGVGSLKDAFTAWEAKDQGCRDLQKAAKAKGQTPPACGTSGTFNQLNSDLKSSMIKELAAGGGRTFLDTFGLIINTLPSRGEIISSCLRDDIWALEDLQNAVLQTMFRGALLGDVAGAATLRNDYIRIGELITLLKNDYKDVDPDDGYTFFPQGRNFYLIRANGEEGAYEWNPDTGTVSFVRDAGCPYGEFQEAIDGVIVHFNNMITALNPTEAAAFGNLSEIANIAKTRAAIRAQQYIVANQVSLTLGGENGGSSKSLIKAQNSTGLSNDFSNIKNVANKEIWKKFAKDRVLNLYGGRERLMQLVDEDVLAIISGSKQALNDEERQKAIDESLAQLDQFFDQRKVLEGDRALIERQDRAIERASYNLTLSYQLNNIAENNLKSFDRTLFELNKQIEFGFEGDGASIVQACENTAYLSKQMCLNNFGNPPSCK